MLKPKGPLRGAALRLGGKLFRSVEVVVHSGAQDVVGHVRVDRHRGEGAGADEAVREVAVVHVEVFDLRAPLVCEHPLRANADRPAGTVVVDARRSRRRDARRRQRVGAQRRANLPVGKAASHIEQPIAAGLGAEIAPGRCRTRAASAGQAASASDARNNRSTDDRGYDDRREIRAATLAGALDIGFDADHPAPVELPIVADLAAANHAVQVCDVVKARSRSRVIRRR